MIGLFDSDQPPSHCANCGGKLPEDASARLDWRSGGACVCPFCEFTCARADRERWQRQAAMEAANLRSALEVRAQLADTTDRGRRWGQVWNRA